MRKLLSFILIPCLLSVFWQACDTDNDGPEPQPSHREEPADSTVIASDTITQNPDSIPLLPDTVSVEQDSILMQYYLMNGRGDTTRTFVEGENMYFQLCLTNLGNREVSVYKDICLVDQDVFRVISDDGTDWGIPWNFPPNSKMPTPLLQPQRTYDTFCSWLSYSIFGDRLPFALKTDNPVLPVGRYRTIASMTTPETEAPMTCVLHFEIVPFETVNPSDCYLVKTTAMDKDIVVASVLQAPTEVLENTPDTGDMIQFSKNDVPEKELETGDSLCVFLLGYKCYPPRLDVPTAKPLYRCQVKLI